LSERSFIVGALTHSKGLLSSYGSIAFRSVILDTLFDVTRNASRLSGAGARLTPPLYNFGLFTDTRATVGEVSWNIMSSPQRVREGRAAASGYLRYQAAASDAIDRRACTDCTGPIPGYARHTAVLGLTVVHAKRVYINGQMTHRFGLTDVWPANGRSRHLQVLRASLSWENPDKHWSLEAVGSAQGIDRPRFTASARRRW